MYILNNKEYRTKTQINDYFKNKKDQYDSGTLLKNTDKDFFDDVIALFQHHDEVECKLKNMIDILIKHNDKKQNAFFIVKPNNELTSISYIHCIKCINKPLKEIKISVQKSNLNQAMRYAIEPQIKRYTKNNPIKSCEFCNSREDIQVDHIILFNILQTNFFNITEIIKPTTFNTHKTMKYKRVFKKKDNDFKQEWIAYHQEHATFRYLCGTCNRCRKKK